MSLREIYNYFDEAQRPLWFVYSGMGSQWAGMGVDLMRIPIFAAAIERYLLLFCILQAVNGIDSLNFVVHKN